MKLKKIISLILVLTLASVSFYGCKKKENVGESASGTLTYWMPLDMALATVVSNYGETPFAKELTRRTGVNVEYIHPANGRASEEFSIMLASNQLPDIVEYSWMNYLGGADKAVEDGFIVSLNDMMETKAPNFYGYLKENPEIDKRAKSDGGNYIGFPAIIGDESLLVSAGLCLRKDWLDELGMSVPETIDDWEKVLTAFRDKKNAAAPLSYEYAQFDFGVFSGAYGVGGGVYLDRGIVKYGPAEPGYKEYLKKMNEWYEAGLIDKNIFSIDGNTVMAHMLGGVSGAAVNSIGGGMGKMISSATDEKFDLVAAPYPVLERGQKPEFGHYNNPISAITISITTDCKDVDSAMKLLDYGYGEEGRKLFNFGIEGESYTVVDGYPRYTEFITDNKDGKPMQTMLALYARAATGTRGSIQDKRYMEQYAKLPQQKNAWEVWSNTNAKEHLLPTMYPTQKDTDLYAKIVVAIDTYNHEMIPKFIMGIEPLSNYDNYVQQLRQRGLDELIRIHQDAYEMYLKR